MSKTAQAHSSSSWKDEVNRRLAEHRDRKPGAQAAQEAPATAAQQNASSRAQEAAARVAARYAKAPSYSEVLANEARAALRAAEAASEAAFHARAAAESVLAGIEAASAAMPQFESHTEPVVFSAAKPEAVPTQSQSMQDRSIEESFITPAALEPAAQYQEPAHASADHGSNFFEEEWWRRASYESRGHSYGEIEIVEPAQLIAGNLIEFPRELVATRKVRPRLTELNDGSSMQLSIFEVDPNSIATAPSADVVQDASVQWAKPAWSDLRLDAQPYEGIEELLPDPEPRSQYIRDLEPATLSRRIMALMIDGMLILGALVAGILFLLTHRTTLPGVHAFEVGSIVSLVIIATSYMACFLALASATPGMVYAGIQFSTFEGMAPTREQRMSRLGAMFLSVLPVGLGLLWALFDDDHLCWHDRLSRTYLCDRF